MGWQDGAGTGLAPAICMRAECPARRRLLRPDRRKRTAQAQWYQPTGVGAGCFIEAAVLTGRTSRQT